MGEEKVGCLGFLFRLFPGLLAGEGGEGGDGAAAGAELPKVMVNNRFITNAEADFFRVLRAVVGERGHILAQVSLKQLLYFPGKGDPGRQKWQNKMAQKSVDFIICDSNTLKPKVVIELDEPSHARPDRQARDDEVERILKAAGLPVVRVLTSRAYDTRELEAAVGPMLQGMPQGRVTKAGDVV